MNKPAYDNNNNRSKRETDKEPQHMNRPQVIHHAAHRVKQWLNMSVEFRFRDNFKTILLCVCIQTHFGGNTVSLK